jgi:hypothetical protein
MLSKSRKLRLTRHVASIVTHSASVRRPAARPHRNASAAVLVIVVLALVAADKSRCHSASGCLYHQNV